MQSLIRAHPEIADTEREPLEAAVTKLLFRDMALVIQGYAKARS